MIHCQNAIAVDNESGREDFYKFFQMSVHKGKVKGQYKTYQISESDLNTWMSTQEDFAKNDLEFYPGMLPSFDSDKMLWRKSSVHGKSTYFESNNAFFVSFKDKKMLNCTNNHLENPSIFLQTQ